MSTEQKVSKTQTAVYKEPSKIEDRKVIMSPAQSIKDGLAFFLRQEQHKVTNSNLTEHQKFENALLASTLLHLQKMFDISGSPEDFKAYTQHIWTQARRTN